MGDLLQLFLAYYLIPFGFIFSFQMLFSKIKVEYGSGAYFEKYKVGDTERFYFNKGTEDNFHYLEPGQIYGKQLFLAPLAIGGGVFIIVVIMAIFRTAQETITLIQRIVAYTLLGSLIITIVSFILFLILRIRLMVKNRAIPIILFIVYFFIAIGATSMAITSFS